MHARAANTHGFPLRVNEKICSRLFDLGLAQQWGLGAIGKMKMKHVNSDKKSGHNLKQEYTTSHQSEAGPVLRVRFCRELPI